MLEATAPDPTLYMFPDKSWSCWWVECLQHRKSHAIYIYIYVYNNFSNHNFSLRNFYINILFLKKTIWEFSKFWLLRQLAELIGKVSWHVRMCNILWRHVELVQSILIQVEWAGCIYIACLLFIEHDFISIQVRGLMGHLYRSRSTSLITHNLQDSLIKVTFWK